MCCGVGVHHQNGIGEAHTKKIVDSARTILLHGKCRWPTVMNAVFWIFALRTAVDFYNPLNLNEHVKSPQDLLSGFYGEIDVKYFHAWGYPVFVLHHRSKPGIGGAPK